MEAVFTSARFSLTAKVSHGTLYLVLIFVGMYFAAASRCASIYIREIFGKYMEMKNTLSLVEDLLVEIFANVKRFGFRHSSAKSETKKMKRLMLFSRIR